MILYYKTSITKILKTMTKLEYYHSTSDFHPGWEVENRTVASQLNNCKTYAEYYKLCRDNGVGNYNQQVFEDHKNGIQY